MNFYGLRRAKTLCREQAKVVKGDNSGYARGFRTALKHVIAAIDEEIAIDQINRDIAASDRIAP